MKARLAGALSGALFASLAVAAFAVPSPAAAQGKGEIRIAHVYSKTGPLEAYGKQTQTGLMMGLDYATGGTMTVAGKKIVVIEKDDQGKPDVGKSLLATAYGDDKADIAVGPSSSGVALAMLPVAEEYKKILLVEPAVADSITGDKWNRYIFRTGRNSSQDAIANAVALDKEGVSIATLAQDYAFGRDGIKAFKDSLKKAKVVHEEYLPVNTSDFTAGGQRIIDALKDKPGRKIIYFYWAGAGNPLKVADMDLKRYGIEVAAGGNILPAMVAYKPCRAWKARPTTTSACPRTRSTSGWSPTTTPSSRRRPTSSPPAACRPASRWSRRSRRPTATPTPTSSSPTMEGMSFESPKGKMTFRKEDHQAMQSMYHTRIKNDPAFAWGVPELVREIKPEEMDVPIKNKR